MKISTSLIGAAATDQGFTLLELLIVLCLTGLVSGALAFAIGGALDRASFERTAADLENEFGRMASLARQTGLDQTVLLQRRGEASELVFGPKVVGIAEPFSVELTSALEARLVGKSYAVVFFGAGGSSGGTVKLTDGKGEGSISIDWLSGRVRRQGAPR